MLVTITSDASYDRVSKQSGYAFLVSSNAGRFQKSGKLKAKNITEAELMAIANSLHYVCHHKELWGVSKIILNVDYIAAEKMILNEEGTAATRKKSGKKYREIIKIIRNTLNILNQKGCKTILFRHVRAHSKTKDVRSKANEYVDKLAVKARKG